jgi:hypothetical protein
MELAATSDPKLLGVLAELRCREPIFHRPELGTSRADFEGMTTASVIPLARADLAAERVIHEHGIAENDRNQE